jgi:hypothetical protein
MKISYLNCHNLLYHVKSNWRHVYFFKFYDSEEIALKIDITKSKRDSIKMSERFRRNKFHRKNMGGINFNPNTNKLASLNNYKLDSILIAGNIFTNLTLSTAVAATRATRKKKFGERARNCHLSKLAATAILFFLHQLLQKVLICVHTV